MESQHVMKILVTGSKGFIGKHLVKKLIENGHRVYEFDLGDSLPDKKMDLVIHLASKVNAYQSVTEPTEARDNIDLLFEVLEWMRKTKTNKIIFSSSREVYSMCNPYGVSKKCAELIIDNYVKLYGITAISLRLANIYGKGNLAYRFIEKTVEQVKNDEDIVIYGGSQKILNFVHVDDCTDRIVFWVNSIMTSTGHQISDVASNKSWKLTDLLQIMIDNLGYDGTVTLDNNRHGETLCYIPDDNQLLICDRTENYIDELCSQS